MKRQVFRVESQCSGSRTGCGCCQRFSLWHTNGWAHLQATDGVKKLQLSSCLLCSQERNQPDTEELLLARAQHGLLLCEQQDHRLRHVHRPRGPGPPGHCQQRLRHRFPLRHSQADGHPVPPSGCGEVVWDHRQHSKDRGGPPVTRCHPLRGVAQHSSASVLFPFYSVLLCCPFSLLVRTVVLKVTSLWVQPQIFIEVLEQLNDFKFSMYFIAITAIAFDLSIPVALFYFYLFHLLLFDHFKCIFGIMETRTLNKGWRRRKYSGVDGQDLKHIPTWAPYQHFNYTLIMEGTLLRRPGGQKPWFCIPLQPALVTDSGRGTFCMHCMAKIKLHVSSLSPLGQSFLLLDEVERRNFWPQRGEKQENCVELEKLTCYWDKVWYIRSSFPSGITDLMPPFKKSPGAVSETLFFSALLGHC